MADKPAALQSEKVIINAPMSFAGSAQRAWRWCHKGDRPKWLAVTLAVLILAVWWPTIAVWYLCFGLLLVPYRLLRRGARKRRAEQMRHREMMAVIEKQQPPNIRVLDDSDAPSIRDLIGLVPDLTDGMTPEEYVRKLRNG